MPHPRSSWSRLALAGILLLAFAVRPCVATTVRAHSLADLADASDLVVSGTVERLEVHAEMHGPPFTLVHVRVAESAKGAGPPVVAMRLPGGRTADGVQCAVAGTPRLAAGDDVLLFLSAVPAGVTARRTVAPSGPLASQARPAAGAQPRDQWSPVGLSLGTWRIVAAPGGRTMASPDPAAHDLHVVGSAAGDLEPAPLDVVLARVRAVARGSRP